MFIIQPENEATIRNNQGKVTVVVQVKPKLKKTDKLQLIFDDKEHPKSQAESAFILNGIDRGMHKLVVKVINEIGMELSASKQVIFFMHRTHRPLSQIK